MPPTARTLAPTTRGRVGALTALAATLAAAGLSAQGPIFRSSVDLIAVDVQVVDGQGDPVVGLAPGAFEVSIRGQRRKVVSAELVHHVGPTSAGSPTILGAPPPLTAPASIRDGRTLILAFDRGSFEIGGEGPPLEAMRAFLGQVGSADRIGLWIFPRGQWIPPTTDRAPLRVALGGVVGEKQPLRSAYNLRPREIVDITAETTSPNSFRAFGRGQPIDTFTASTDPVLLVQRRECPAEVDCPMRIYQEAMGLAAQIEQDVQESLSGIELLMQRLSALPGRKSVVLVSAGLMVSDRLEGRPDVGKMADLIGQTAARANTTVYTIHFDQISSASQGMGAQRSAGTSAGLLRDRALYGRWLDEFSGGAGGTRLYVPTGRGDFAFDRVLRESSAYYLLAVEPATVDRDGKPRELAVKLVGQRGASIRSRHWVIVPAARP